MSHGTITTRASVPGTQADDCAEGRGLSGGASGWVAIHEVHSKLRAAKPPPTAVRASIQATGWPRRARISQATNP
jgi:hypothetical protein